MANYVTRMIRKHRGRKPRPPLNFQQTDAETRRLLGQGRKKMQHGVRREHDDK